MRLTADLCQSELFNIQTNDSDNLQQAEKSYLRAEAISKAYGLTLEDILNVSPKFWQMHTDPIVQMDGGATTLLTIQYNLVVGTIGMFVGERKDLEPLLQDLVEYKTIGQICLTELGHGLNALYLQTTATLQSDGTFDLHTPNDQAAKYMPPTIPVLGRTCIAVVFAQLIVEGEHRGLRPFIVTLNDGHCMSPGIKAKLLPRRSGAHPVNHAITSFNHVRLPSTALLGNLKKPSSLRIHFLLSIIRVSVGTLALSSSALPGLQIASHIAYHYSIRRTIYNHDGSQINILSFRTQQIPVFTAVAQCYVLQAFTKHSINYFIDQSLDPRSRHGVATIYKAVCLQHSQSSQLELSERCGAQGLFGYNQIITQYCNTQGIAIAEGDILVLTIRLVSELCIGRYSLPQTSNPESLLAKHEASVFEECHAIAKQYGHRSKEFSSYVLPKCRSVIEAMGHRAAYDAAVADEVPQTLIDIYICHVIKLDLAWYIEKGLLTRAQFTHMEAEAFEKAVPLMHDWVEQMDVGSYIKAPIVSDDRWAKFGKSLYCYDDVKNASHVVDTNIESTSNVSVENMTIPTSSNSTEASVNNKI